MRRKVSVLKRFRSESKMQFYATAQKLRKDIMTLLLKDFGVRSKVRQLDIETRRMTTDDRNAFLAIAEKYGITAAGSCPQTLHQRAQDAYHAFAAGFHVLQDPLFLYCIGQAPHEACQGDFREGAAKT